MGDPDIPLRDGFHWRDGQEADTKGVHIWNEPFIVNKDGKEVNANNNLKVIFLQYTTLHSGCCFTDGYSGPLR